MLITIKNVKHEWQSDDKKINIWGLTDQDGNNWKTMSEKIANSEGQTMELTTRVSKNGKTYLVQPPKEGYPSQAPAQQTLGGGMDENLVARIEMAISAFEDAIARFVKIVPWDGTEKIAASGDVVPTEIDGAKKFDDALKSTNLAGNQAAQEALKVFEGGEIVDDLP